MLWRFRREIILLFFLFMGFFFLHRKTFFNVFGEKHDVVSRINTFSIDDLLRENRRLVELLKLKDRYVPGKIVYARVIEISPWVFPSVIKLDKGLSSGVTDGMSIVSKNGFLIGRVTSAGQDFSSGITLFHPDNKVSITVSSTGELAILEGGSFPYLKIKFLPPECRAAPGDTIETSGFTQLFPSGITIGKIVRMSRSSYELSTEGYVKPFFYYDNFEEVCLVK